MPNCSVCIWIRILRSWLGSLSSRQVSAPILSASCDTTWSSSTRSGIGSVGPMLAWTTFIILVLSTTILLDIWSSRWTCWWSIVWCVSNTCTIWWCWFLVIVFILGHILVLVLIFYFSYNKRLYFIIIKNYYQKL